MVRILLEVEGADDMQVIEGVFICHVVGEDDVAVKLVSYNDPSASAQIGMLTQTLDRVRAVQVEKWK